MDSKEFLAYCYADNQKHLDNIRKGLPTPEEAHLTDMIRRRVSLMVAMAIEGFRDSLR